MVQEHDVPPTALREDAHQLGDGVRQQFVGTAILDDRVQAVEVDDVGANDGAYDVVPHTAGRYGVAGGGEHQQHDHTLRFCTKDTEVPEKIVK